MTRRTTAERGSTCSTEARAGSQNGPTLRSFFTFQGMRRALLPPLQRHQSAIANFPQRFRTVFGSYRAEPPAAPAPRGAVRAPTVTSYAPPMPSPVVLVPPSEGKAAGGDGAPWTSGSMRFDALDDDRREVVDALRRAMRADATSTGKLLGVKGDALAAARAANRAVLSSPTMPAIERYTGVLYGELDATSLPAAARRRAATGLVIVSGLWGLVAPGDPVPDYKLKMGASLTPLGRLSTWWRPRLTAALAPVVRRRVVWDLLPNEHAAAWAPEPDGPALRCSVTFVDDVGSGSARKQVAVAHWNKLLKGSLVRHVLTTGLDDPAGLAAFEHPLGYRYDPARTTEADGRTQVVLVARKP